GVSLDCSGRPPASIHRCYPTTDRYGGFDLLRFRPGPVHPSSDDLVILGSPRSTISTPILVWTSARHSSLQPRTPNSNDPPVSASQILGLQGHATAPGESRGAVHWVWVWFWIMSACQITECA